MFCLLLAGGLAVGAAACGSGSGEGTGTGGKIKITVTGQPPTSQPFERGVFDADVREFEENHPDIDIEPHEGRQAADITEAAKGLKNFDDNEWHPETFADAWNQLSLGKYFLNTIIVAGGAWLAQLAIDVEFRRIRGIHNY